MLSIPLCSLYQVSSSLKSNENYKDENSRHIKYKLTWGYISQSTLHLILLSICRVKVIYEWSCIYFWGWFHVAEEELYPQSNNAVVHSYCINNNLLAFIYWPSCTLNANIDNLEGAEMRSSSIPFSLAQLNSIQ
jgi:hypothetical protein